MVADSRKPYLPFRAMNVFILIAPGQQRRNKGGRSIMHLANSLGTTARPDGGCPP